MVEPIKIIYRDGAYRVNRPNWDGGEVVMASHYAALEAQLAEANKALDAALDGLEAGCNQYANRTFSGVEVPGDEQYPWVRLMMIGRDTARRALGRKA